MLGRKSMMASSLACLVYSSGMTIRTRCWQASLTHHVSFPPGLLDFQVVWLPQGSWPSSSFSFIFKILFYYLFLERGEGRKEEKHQCVVVSWAPPTGDLAHNPGMCPEWESNQWPFGSQAGTQATEPHQPGLAGLLLSGSFQEEGHRTS